MISVIRAEETWQQAGAYYVRIQGMAKQHHITLLAEFDEHDTPDTRYFVLTDDDFPIATSRLYPIDDRTAMIGRVVVLPEYRSQHLGTRVMQETESWLRDMAYTTARIESRENAVGFYQKLGYHVISEIPIIGETFTCIAMEKDIS